MKYVLSWILYWIGDILSRTIMMYGRGYGYGIYKTVMLWSVDLDEKGKIWKHIKK